REGHALRVAERPHHGPSAIWWFPGAGDRYHATRSGDPEPEEAVERGLCEAYRATAEEDRGRAGARHVPDGGCREGLRADRQGDRQAPGRSAGFARKGLSRRSKRVRTPGMALAWGFSGPSGAAIDVVTRDLRRPATGVWSGTPLRRQ